LAASNGDMLGEAIISASSELYIREHMNKKYLIETI
jgi:hypothetical protein